MIERISVTFQPAPGNDRPFWELFSGWPTPKLGVMTVNDDEYTKKRKPPAPWYTALENFVTDYFLFFVIALVLGWLLYSAFFPASEPIDLPGYQIDFY